MRRFFIPPEALAAEPPAITGAEALHMAVVLRLKKGDTVILFDGTGHEYDAQILSASKKQVTFRISGKRPICKKPCIAVTLAQGLLKGRKMDLVTRQLTELGIAQFIPFVCEHSVARPGPERLQVRQRRWEKIVQEAMKQCRRNLPMTIGPCTTFSEILSMSDRFAHKILFWEKEKTRPPFRPEPGGNDTGPVLAVLGPEGGFSEQEVSDARKSGFTTVSLGPFILKAETAAVAAAALLRFCFSNPYPS